MFNGVMTNVCYFYLISEVNCYNIVLRAFPYNRGCYIKYI